MFFLLIFPILVAGFLACHIHPIHYYKLHRYEGQYLYLKSSKLGLVCFGWGFLIAVGIHRLVPESIQFCELSINLNIEQEIKNLMGEMGASDDKEKAKMAWFLILSTTTIFSAWLIKIWGHVSLKFRFGKFWDNKVYVIGELLDDSPIDSILFKLSFDKTKHIMLSMADRKVYVGSVIRMGEPTETNGMDQDITIMPLMSGFRDKDDLKVTFDTHYDDAEYVTLSLRQDAITSATEFNFDVWDKLNPPKTKKLYQKTTRKQPGYNYIYVQSNEK